MRTRASIIHRYIYVYQLWSIICASVFGPVQNGKSKIPPPHVELSSKSSSAFAKEDDDDDGGGGGDGCVVGSIVVGKMIGMKEELLSFPLSISFWISNVRVSWS